MIRDKPPFQSRFLNYPAQSGWFVVEQPNPKRCPANPYYGRYEVHAHPGSNLSKEEAAAKAKSEGLPVREDGTVEWWWVKSHFVNVVMMYGFEEIHTVTHQFTPRHHFPYASTGVNNSTWAQEYEALYDIVDAELNCDSHVHSLFRTRTRQKEFRKSFANDLIWEIQKIARRNGFEDGTTHRMAYHGIALTIANLWYQNWLEEKTLQKA